MSTPLLPIKPTNRKREGAVLEFGFHLRHRPFSLPRRVFPESQNRFRARASPFKDLTDPHFFRFRPPGRQKVAVGREIPFPGVPSSVPSHFTLPILPIIAPAFSSMCTQPSSGNTITTVLPF